MSNLFLHTPNIGSEEKEEVCKALDSGMLTCGLYLKEFELELSVMLMCSAILCSSGTAALHIGLHALGIGPGDEVIVPDVSFISTVNSVLYRGATPVICDIGDPEYELSIDPDKVAELINPNTRAIIVAHLFGGHGNIEKLLDIADVYGVDIIEDAAQSVGCSINGEALGTFGKFGIYSFNGNKIITAGGGGVLITSDGDIGQRVRNLLNQAKDFGNPFSHIEMGYNYRMSNIHAAIGYTQLKKLESFIKKKKFIYETYKKKLDLVSYKDTSNYWLSVYKSRHIQLEQACEYLKERGIQSRPLYVPFHRMNYLKKYCQEKYPVSEKLYNSLLCLPSDLSLNKKSIDKVVDEINILEVGDV